MKLPAVHVVFSSILILLAAALAHVLVPREILARSSDTFDLHKVIPRNFGEWTLVPNVRLIEPPGPDTLSRQIYSQESARGYVDREGHLVMLLVAYGPNQSNRLQLHRPEICYAAEGFRVSRQREARVSYREGALPLNLMRLTARREGRLEPVSYWMRIGDEIATGVIERQIIKLKYGLKGVVPDGALIRVSTTGLAEEQAFIIQNRFIRDLLTGVASNNLSFFVGNHS